MRPITQKQIIAVLLLGAMACAGSTACKRKEPDFVDIVTIGRYNTPLAASASTPTGSELDGEFTAALTDFSQTLFRKSLTKQDSSGENFVLSPLSVTYALTLSANGAKGDTLGQFNELNGGIDVVQMNEYLYTLTRRMATTEGSTVDVANSIWTNSGSFAINEAFAEVAKKYYDAEVGSVDFMDKATPDIINTWVSRHTDGMIPKALDKIDPMTAMLLINTVLFDGKWAGEYMEFDVWEEEFRNADGTETVTDFLHSTEHSYFEAPKGVGFSKEYKDGYRFVAILPEEGVAIADFVSELNLADAIAASRKGHEPVVCAIPEFSYDVTADLNQTLLDMGLTRAFSETEAELEGLGKSDLGSLYISNVLQKAKITLDRHGTKAAAMTEVAIMATSAAPTTEPKHITLDRPFFYMILDSEADLPLFLGVLCNVNP